MKKYLLDTNICIFYLKGRFDLDTKVRNVGVDNCFVSEITVAELKFGAENSEHVERNRSVVTNLLSVFQVIPVFGSLECLRERESKITEAG